MHVLYCFATIGSNPLLGDLCCVTAGFLFAIVNVGLEYILKGQLSVLDATALLSFCGAAVTGIQV